MSGIDSSAPAPATADPASLVSFSVHSLPSPAGAEAARRTARGRRYMLAVLLVCTAPVVASYLAYFVIKPQARTNYSDLISPPRPMPAALGLTDLHGRAVTPLSLQGQWLLVVVAGGACDKLCERHLWLQRQLHETLGREKERVDKVWLIDDGVAPGQATLEAIGSGAAASSATAVGLAGTQVLAVARADLARWLDPVAPATLEDHLYIVDPSGDWMMRAPVDADPVKLKRDVDKLLRASAGWDRPGR
jgi:hypothetical protein